MRGGGSGAPGRALKALPAVGSGVCPVLGLHISLSPGSEELMANPGVFSPQDSAASGSAPRARGANGGGSVWSPGASSLILAVWRVGY